MKLYVEQLKETFEFPDGMSDDEIKQTVEETLIAPTKFKDASGNRLTQFEAADRKRQIEDNGLLESKEPNFYWKHVVPFFQELGVQTGDFKKPAVAGPPKAEVFTLTGFEAFSGLNVADYTREELDKADPAVNLLGLRLRPLSTGGALTGGVGSLLAVQSVLLKTTQIPTLTAQATSLIAQSSPKLARFIPGMIVSGSTFGTQTFIHETVRQAQDGQFDFPELSKKTLESTGLGVGLGSLGGFGSLAKDAFKTKVAGEIAAGLTETGGAGAIGYLFAKHQGADDAEALLQAGMFSLFQFTAQFSRTQAMNRAIIFNVTKPFVAKYIRTRNPNISQKAALAMAEQVILRDAAKHGGINKVLKDKRLVLENIESYNKRLLEATNYMRAKPEKPVEGIPKPFAKGEAPAKAVTPVKPEIKFKPASPEVAPAVEMAKKYDDIVKFTNDLFLPENLSVAKAFQGQITAIRNEEVQRLLKVDMKQVELDIAKGESRATSIQKQLNISPKEAAVVEKKIGDISRAIQTDAIEQVFARAQVERANAPAPAPAEPTPAAPTPVEPQAVVVSGLELPLSKDGEQIFALTANQLGAQKAQDILAVAQKIAQVDKKKEIGAKEVAEAVKLDSPEKFIENAIKQLPTVEVSGQTLNRAEAILGGVKEPVEKATAEFNEFKKNKPTTEQIDGKINELLEKFVPKEKGPEKPKEVKIREAEGDIAPKPSKGPKPKPIKNSDPFPKTAKGDNIVGSVEINGKEFPVLISSKAFNELKPIDFPEIVRITKEILGKVPQVEQRFRGTGTRGMFSFKIKEGKAFDVKIRLQPELFERGNELRLALVLAHELGHLIDYLPELQPIESSNLLGRLLKIRGFLKDTFGDLEVQNRAVKKELMDLSELIRPLTPERNTWEELKGIDKDFFDYRAGPSELYADFVSALFNSPGLTEKMAPKTMKLFFDNLDKNPKVKEAFIQMQKSLSGVPENILAQRSGIMRESFMKGEQLRQQLVDLARLKNLNFWEAINDIVVEANGPVLRNREKLEAKGKILPSKGNPIYELQEHSLVDEENFLMVGEMDTKVFNPLSQVGIDKLTLGEYLFLMRVVGRPDIDVKDFKGLFKEFDEVEEKMIVDLIQNLVDRGFKDRQELANPFGFAPKTAQEQLDFMKKSLGEDKFKLLEQKAQIFHDIVFRSIEQAFIDGTYPRSLEPFLRQNKDFYVTFGVLSYLEQFVPANVQRQAGTLADIENPVITTILKMISLNRWNSKNRASRAIVRSVAEVQKKFGEEQIREIKTPRGPGGVPTGTPKAKAGRGIIVVYQDGKPKFFEVDKSIAQVVNEDKTGNLLAISILDTVLQNDFFKNVFVTWNLGFGLFSNLQRDFFRTQKNLQALGLKVPFWRLIKEYIDKNNKGPAQKFAKGEIDAVTLEMMKNKAMTRPIADFNLHPETDPLTRLLKEIEVLQGKNKLSDSKTVGGKLAKKWLGFLEAIRYMGSWREVRSKVVGYNLLKEKNLSDKERAYLTRNFIGTPNFNEKGKFSWLTNRVYMFSNIAIRDYLTSIQLAKNPETRAGWWFHTLRWGFLPKFIMILGAAGFLGKKIEDLYDDMSEYTKTNHIAFPIGRADDGRVYSARFFMADSDRFLSGLMWKTMMGFIDKKPKQLAQVFDFASGQMPLGLSPMLKLGNAWGNYLAGENPRDSFKGQDAIPDREFKAGGLPSLKKMVRWSVDQTGLGQYIVAQDRLSPKDDFFEAVVRLNPVTTKLIQLSDSGLNQKFREIRELEEKESAQLQIQKEEAFSANLKRLDAGENLNQIMRDIEVEVFQDKKIDFEEKNRLKAGFLAFALREQEDTFVNALLNARSNKNKVKVLMEIRQRKSEQEFDEFIKFLLKNKVISFEANRTLKRVIKDPDLLDEL